jgi:uncharacterized repeat protein (TIGR01451 family)/LPXTG-motif cell wall-anchored protein
MNQHTHLTKWIRLVISAALALAVGIAVGSSTSGKIVQAADVVPETAFEIDGDRVGPNDFAAPYANGTTPGTLPTGGFPTTGLYYNVQSFDENLASGCDIKDDPSVPKGGTAVGDGPAWAAPGTADPNGKTDLDFVDLAAEKVDKNGQIFDILYVGYRKCGGEGTWQTALYLDDGDGILPSAGDADGDYLFIFDFNPSSGDVTFYPYQRVAGAWTPYNDTDVYIEGKALGDYGEVALNLTGLQIIGGAESTTCNSVTVSGPATSITGGSLTSQIKDLLNFAPLTISNCGGLDVKKISSPADVENGTYFPYVVSQTDGKASHDNTLNVSGVDAGKTAEPTVPTTEIAASIQVNETHAWRNVISQPDYTLSETSQTGWQIERIECSFYDIFTKSQRTVTIWDGGPTGNEFLVPPSVLGTTSIAPASCTIDNATSAITVVKAGSGDPEADFAFAVTGQSGFSLSVADDPATTGVDESQRTFSVQPSTAITITETIATPGTGEPAWTLESIECTKDSDGSTVLAETDPADGTIQVQSVAADGITCVFTNQQDARLTLVKKVVNDNGGDAVVGDWTLSASGTTPLSGTSGVSSDVEPGSYDLSESGGPADYTGGSWSCVGGSQTDGDTISLAAGDAATCTITNDDDAPSLTLVKQVINDNGGTAVPGDFTLVATGFDPQDPQAGTYDLSESGPAGYTQVSLTCSNSTGQVTSVTLALGEDVTCTFVNDDDAPSLTLVKQVINDNGGTAVPGDFTLVATGFDPQDPQAGTYDLSESGPAGYTQVSLTCDNSTGQVSSVTLALGEDVTCTFVNDDLAPGLTLVKQVINDNGGTAQPGDFSLVAAGYDPQNPAAGTYDLSESGPAGYTQVSLTCSNSTGQVTSVTLGLGESVSCTFVNDDDAPSLTLVKEVINDNGGTATPGDFTLVAAGYDSVSPDAGSYVLSESGPAGYTQVSLYCDNSTGQVTSVTLALGEDVTCTFVNDDDAPSLTLVKKVINDNGGTAAPGDFTLVAAGFDPQDPQVGTYDLSESGPAGYTQVSLYCDNSTGQVTSVTLALGEDVTCTFVNDDDAPSLTLVKEVINDNGGTAAPGDFTLVAAGYDSVSPDAGSYDLSESGPAGYTQVSLTCDNLEGQVTSVTLALGEDVTCTFVNDDDAPSLTLVKKVINDNGGTAAPGDFTLVAAGYDSVSPDAGTYDLSESGPAGYTQVSLYCDNSTGQVTSVTLALGEDVTCTFVNDDDAPSLTLVKEVINDNGGTAEAGDWTLTATGPTGFSGTTGVASDASFDAGSYDLSESGPAGYTGSDWECAGGEQDGATIVLGLGDQVTCTITNDDDAPSLTLVKEVVNDNGGTAEAGDWTLTATGPTGFSGTTGVASDASFDAGSYDLSESGPAGYAGSDWECVGGEQTDGDTIAIGLGDEVTCTITNDDLEPGLTLRKIVQNDNGGTAEAGDWTLTATGPTGFSGTTGVSFGDGFAAGSYDLSESGPDGYTGGDWVCEGGDQTDGDTVVVGLGETVLCTITNDDDAPSLTLVKELVNDDGGNAVIGDFVLTADGPTGISGGTGVTSDGGFSAGTYHLSENDIAGYSASAWECVGGTQDDDDTVTIGLGEDVTCTITNDDDPVDLELVKGDDDFAAIAGGDPIPYTISVANIGTRDADLGEPITMTDVLPDHLSWVEPVPAGCEVDGQTLTCDVDPASMTAGGDPVVFELLVNVAADTPTGVVENRAWVDLEDDPVCEGEECSPPPCPALDNNNVDCEETPVDRFATITIVKTDDVADGDSVQPGEVYRYTLEVTNNGPSTILPGLTVDDDLPAELVLVNVDGGPDWDCVVDDPIQCVYGPALGVDETAPVITVTVQVAESAAGEFIDNVAVATGYVETDCVEVEQIGEALGACAPITDDDDERTPLDAVADLAILKSASISLPTGPGGGFDWILDVTNNGPGAAVGVVVGDEVPASLQITEVTSSFFDCGFVAQAVTCTRDSMAVGASGTITISVLVRADAVQGVIVNVGSVVAETPDPDLTNNSDDASVDVVVQFTPTTTVAQELPKTGGDSSGLVRTALILLLLGVGVVGATRRRRPAAD